MLAWRFRAVRLPGAALAWWLGSVMVFGAGVAVFDDLAYGGPLKSPVWCRVVHHLGSAQMPVS